MDSNTPQQNPAQQASTTQVQAPTIAPQNYAIAAPQQQNQEVKPQVEEFGDPGLWRCLSQKADKKGNFEKTDVMVVERFGLIMCQTIVHNGVPTVSLLALPSTKVVQAVDANGQPMWQGSIPIPALASTNA